MVQQFLSQQGVVDPLLRVVVVVTELRQSQGKGDATLYAQGSLRIFLRVVQQSLQTHCPGAVNGQHKIAGFLI